jgi:hypothetical protein
MVMWMTGMPGVDAKVTNAVSKFADRETLLIIPGVNTISVGLNHTGSLPGSYLRLHE